MNSSGLASSAGDRVTLLLHTRGRPDFVLRSLCYFDELAAGSSLRLLVLDGSDESTWSEIRNLVEALEFRSRIELRHADESTPLLTRLADGLSAVGTPYVMPAANDDFYLPGWLDQAVDELDREPDLGTVHGHVIFFMLADYAPYSPLQHYFVHPREVPPVSWLEADSAAERIASVTDGSHEPSVPGWYALQRTDHLRTIIDHAVRIGLPDAYLEYWLVFYQAVLGKTRMLDRIILARQADPGAVHPSPSFEGAPPWLERMRTEFLDLLTAAGSAGPETAERVVDRYLRGVVSELRRSDARRFPFGHDLLRTAWRRLRGKPASAADSRAATYPDPRLPRLPAVGPDHPAIKLIGRWTRPQDDGRN